ncbi:MAG: Fe-S cluster assembly protein SufD [Candidatus Omnitrophica bacterium]|nr:Fe-S cluster assembly protein SufD [Candidatus Omnitrophota bacterium]
MINKLDAQDRYTEHFAQMESHLMEISPDWARPLRKAAIEHFAGLGFPTIREENWKYTNLAALAHTPFIPAATLDQEGFDLSDLQDKTAAELPGHRLVFINGVFNAAQSRLNELPPGVTVCPLSIAFKNSPVAVDNYMTHVAPCQGNALVALNTAFWTDGAFVHIAPGTIVHEPIQIVFASGGKKDMLVTFPRVLVVASPGSEASLIQYHVDGLDSHYWANCVCELVLDDNSSIEHYLLQEESVTAYHTNLIEVKQASNSNYVSHNFCTGSALARTDLNVRLTEEGAKCSLYGLYSSRGTQHLDNHTLIDHISPRCTSHEFYKGILNGKSRAVFNGKVMVRPDSQGTDARQENRNLLLSEDAQIDTKPELEIYANDVKCSHGATVGQLDEDALFYLRSRGVGANAARHILTLAFASELLERVQIPLLADHLHWKTLPRCMPSARIFESVG